MMTLTQASQRRTLLILTDPTESAFHDLRSDLTSAGLKPLIQHYPCAFVILDGPGLSRFCTDSRVAAIVSRCVPDEAITALPRGVHDIVRNWNYSFSPEYRRIELIDRELEGRHSGLIKYQ